ncbi:MAG TPA: GNAT family protein [Candidatus Thermoplasmatota archaeon]|jgi:RimJ/RimL family protein N-acetyltransferase|nr:GNAT family protein [Candidatus Thermoplasmatota archaeon]
MDRTVPTLQGRWVRLEPLRAEHAKDLWDAAREREIWRYMTFDVASPSDLDAWIAMRLADARDHGALVFVQRDARTGQAFGSTSIFDLRPKDKGVEIGHTWIGASHRGTPANTEAKLLLLTHGFEALGAIRVQLKTDARNARSRAAIERLGAQFEGILRHHSIMPDGYRRDTAMYSILAAEWPGVKARLQESLARPRGA